MRQFTILAFLAISVLSLQIGCSSGQPVAYGDETLHLYVSAKQLHANGDQTQVTVNMTKADGMPVLDNTRVLLSATAGYFLEQQLSLLEGRATTTYFTDSFVGDVDITASSGSVGADGSIKVTVTIVESDDQPASMTALASPSTVEKKGDVVQLKAYVYNSTGQPLLNKPVLFTTSYGVLSSNGYPVSTDNTGKAEDSLLVNQALVNIDNITVSVSCVDQSSELTIPVIQNVPPTSEFTYSPSSPQVMEDVRFTSKATDPDGSINGHLWQFGDGDYSTTENPIHIYQTPGTYQVSLEVEDNGGSTSTTDQTIEVTSGEVPEPAFTYTPNPIRAGEAITFDGSLSIDADGSITQYEWNFGSGYVRQGVQTTWVFQSAGTVSVTLRVTDNTGNRVALTKELQIEGNTAPTAVIKYSPSSPDIEETVQFYGNESTDEDGNVVGYSWSFGDGWTSTQQNPTHSYSTAGEYLVQLTVTDNSGGVGRSSISLTISDNEPPVASFYISPQSPEVMETIQFSAIESSDSDGSIQSYAWDFGDGSFGQSVKATHAFSAAGTYVVLLTVTDNGGATGSTQKSIVISEQQNNAPVIALATVPATITTATAEVLLDASATTDDHTPIHELTFTFEVTTIEAGSGSLPFVVTVNDTANAFVKTLSLSGAESGDIINIVLTVVDADGLHAVKSVNLQVQ